MIRASIFRGATSWEGFVSFRDHELWFRIPFWKYLQLGATPVIGYGDRSMSLFLFLLGFGAATWVLIKLFG